MCGGIRQCIPDMLQKAVESSRVSRRSAELQKSPRFSLSERDIRRNSATCVQKQ